VGLIGAGFMARGLTNQIINSVKGMRLVAIYNRRVERAISASSTRTRLTPVVADTQDALEDALRKGPRRHRDAMLREVSPYRRWSKRPAPLSWRS
jgi:predicted homoserine dehydrogenase-like protein